MMDSGVIEDCMRKNPSPAVAGMLSPRHKRPFPAMAASAVRLLCGPAIEPAFYITGEKSQ